MGNIFFSFFDDGHGMNNLRNNDVSYSKNEGLTIINDTTQAEFIKT